MKKSLLLAVAAAAATLVATPQAQARDGCGRGFHENFRGRCVPNRGRFYRAEPGIRLVIGNFYPGRGYWDGRRYWPHRYRWHEGWRYR